MPLIPIYNTLGHQLAATLPGFHTFTGCDTCDHFHGKSKVTCFKKFMKASSRVIWGLKDSLDLSSNQKRCIVHWASLLASCMELELLKLLMSELFEAKFSRILKQNHRTCLQLVEHKHNTYCMHITNHLCGAKLM